jgi:hypothetical protein
MERIVKGRSATLTKTFTFTPTGTPTVVLTRVSDGTTVTTGGVSGATTTWTYTIPASSNTLLDTYTETWTAVSGGSSQSFVDYIQVAGGVLFQLDELKVLKTGGSSTIGSTFTDAQVGDARTYAETELERECGEYGFVPRYNLETVNGENGGTVRLSGWPVRSIRSVTVTDPSGGTTTYSASQLTALRFQGAVVSNLAGWTAGYGNFTVGYEYGSDFPPPGASEAALILAKSRIVRGPIDDRATQQATEYGTINMATPGMFGSRYGLPAVDAFIRANKIPNVA